MAALMALEPVPLLVLGAYILLSAASFILYGIDKSAARRGRWRTPEITLHLLSVAGGWPGALLGQRIFRHKTRKQPFRGIFWCTVIVNCGVLVWFLAGG
ncbi:MAG: DUF1294 domain-containing protein [Desulfobacterales bacterium]|nr:DUF1294 domain-containing protein [Desulfobacterales bacterium]